MTNFFNFVLRWSFYLLIFLVPLVFYSGSHELFEYSKMMLTYAGTIIIVTSWLGKMVSEKKLIFRRTFLDIPILAYLLSHIISTIFSLDPHTSLWGYYTRFHEGLFATISYIALYYALVSNLVKKDVIKIITFGFMGASIVSIWGWLEHNGHSISCAFIPPNNFDVSCWIQDVKSRVFATLGQPNWMAAYLDIIILTSIGLLVNSKFENLNSKQGQNPKTALKLGLKYSDFILICLSSLFFAALVFTRSRSGIIGLAIGTAVFLILFLVKYGKAQIKNLRLVFIALSVFCLISLSVGLPLPVLDKINLGNLLSRKQAIENTPKTNPSDGYIDIGISESGDIRKIVWEGAIKVWQRYPIFGSGVETFAYAYYKDRPVAHNYVSEWDFLYNKAHNEFLNVLATTGSVGMLAYLSLIAVYIYWAIKTGLKTANDPILVFALLGSYISILITNFFGFSVVIVGIYFFLIPGFSLLLTDKEQPISKLPPKSPSNATQLLAWGILGIAVIFCELKLINMWQADKAFAYGKNLDGVQAYVQASDYLQQAVTLNPDEPTFTDELSYNDALLATLINQAASTSAQKAMIDPYIQSAIKYSNETIVSSPNSLPFWKTRTKVFYQLSAIQPNYILQSLEAITKAAELAPTDPKVHYNLGLILGRAGQTNDAIKAFEETVAMKIDYRDAHYALAAYYKELGNKDKAKEQLNFILNRIGPDKAAQDLLKEL